MKYTEIQSQLERIKNEIRNENDGVKIKKLLREKLNEIGILLYEYTSPMLTAVTHGQKANKNQGRGGKSVTNNFGVVTNNNCPDQGKNPGILFDSQTRIGDFKIQNLADLNKILGDVIQN